jgi:hypothetical protein
MLNGGVHYNRSVCERRSRPLNRAQNTQNFFESFVPFCGSFTLQNR